MANNSISINQRIILGCKALAGENITQLAREHGTNREFIYIQRDIVYNILHENFNVPNLSEPTLVLNKETLKRTVIGCMVICKGSIEDTQEFLDKVYGVKISVGNISRIINEAADNAKSFNESIHLDQIEIGAHDEIFQAGTPILVGVDVYSTFIYLMQKCDTRDSVDWALALLYKIDQGLKLNTSVNDGATGLNKGLEDAFPGIHIQSDVFHAIYKISLGISALERSAYKVINREYALEVKCLKSFDRGKDKYLDKYEVTQREAKEAISIYDRANILYQWIREALKIGGLSLEDRMYTLEYAVQEFSLLLKKNPYLEKGIRYLSEHKEGLLYFVQSAKAAIKTLVREEDIGVQALNLMWEQYQYPEDSPIHNIIEGEISWLLRDKYMHIRKKFNELMSKIVRASSIVECINSLIRPYLFLKRVVGNKFLDLLQCYFNTREYKRSRVPERRGKSPIELLTGNKYPDFLEILGLVH